MLIVIDKSGEDPYPYFLKDEEELQEWLEDGSFSEGDEVYKAEKYALIKEKTEKRLDKDWANPEL